MSGDVAEGTGRTAPAPERKSLADEYLAQATEALRAAGSPETLYGEQARTSDKPMMHAAARAIATGKRVGYSRTGVLFAALAAEAFINEFLDEQLSRTDCKAVDRLPTLEKYILGPRLALGAALFDRGAEPAGAIKELFSLRDKVVHSKPREVPPRGSVFDNPVDFETYNPNVAARFIVAVADAAIELAQHSAQPLQNTTALMIAWGPKVILDYGSKATHSLPGIRAPIAGDLVSDLIKHKGCRG